MGLVLDNKRARVSPVTILVAIVMLLLPALAWMQYQWLGQLSEAERERMQRTLRTAASQFANEFDTELARTLVSLQVDGAALRDQNWNGYAQQYSRWSTSVSEPRIVRDVWLVDTTPGTVVTSIDSAQRVSPDRLRIKRWSAPAMSFEDAPWPDDLLELRDSLAARFIGFQVQRGLINDPNAHRETSVSLTIGEDTTLIAPITLVEFPADHRGPPKISILGFTIVRLDPQILRETLLTTLAARHFSDNGSEANYRLAVLHSRDSSNVVWESEPGAAAIVAARPDVSQPFMGARPDRMLIFARGMRGSGALPPPPPPPPPRPDTRLAERSESKVVISMVEREDRVSGGLSHEGRWMLLAQHRTG